MWQLLVGGSIVGLAVLAYSKIGSLTTMTNNLIVTPKFDGPLSNLKLSLTTLTIPLKVDFGNRSDQTITVQLQAFDAFFGTKLLAQSQPTAIEVQLLPNSTRTLAGLKINISLLSLISIIGDIVKTYTAKSFRINT